MTTASRLEDARSAGAGEAGGGTGEEAGVGDAADADDVAGEEADTDANPAAEAGTAVDADPGEQTDEDDATGTDGPSRTTDPLTLAIRRSPFPHTRSAPTHSIHLILPACLSIAYQWGVGPLFAGRANAYQRGVGPGPAFGP